MTAIETEEGRRWAESKIKALTGGDRISARFMRQDFFEFIPQFKLVIAGNHKPGLRGVDEAIRRRFLLLPFAVTVPAEICDPDLPKKLRAEWPGILAWAIAGCIDWQERGLRAPETVLKATEKYLEAEDALNLWIGDRAERDPDVWELSADLFASWADWAKAAGEAMGTQKRLVQALEAAGFTNGHNISRTKRGFWGLRIVRPGRPDDSRFGD